MPTGYEQLGHHTYEVLDRVFNSVPFKSARSLGAYSRENRNLLLVDPENSRRWKIRDEKVAGDIRFEGDNAFDNARDVHVYRWPEESRRALYRVSFFGDEYRLECSPLFKPDVNPEFMFENDDKSPEDVFKHVIDLSIRPEVKVTMVEQ